MRSALSVLIFAIVIVVAVPASAGGNACRAHQAALLEQLGVEAIDMTVELRLFFRAPANAGLLVTRVIADSPADRGKIAVGDVLLELDRRRLGSVEGAAETLDLEGLGEPVKGTKEVVVEATVIRNRRQRRIQLRVPGPSAPRVSGSTWRIIWPEGGSAGGGTWENVEATPGWSTHRRRVQRSPEVIWGWSEPADQTSSSRRLHERIDGLEKRLDKLDQ